MVCRHLGHLYYHLMSEMRQMILILLRMIYSPQSSWNCFRSYGNYRWTYC